VGTAEADFPKAGFSRFGRPGSWLQSGQGGAFRAEFCAKRGNVFINGQKGSCQAPVRNNLKGPKTRLNRRKLRLRNGFGREFLHDNKIVHHVRQKNVQ
jgi:hypothetical protein